MAEFSIRATLTGPLIVQGATELLDTVGDKYHSTKTRSLFVVVVTHVTNHSATAPTIKFGFQATEKVADMKS